MIQSFQLRLQPRGASLGRTESAHTFCKTKAKAAGHLTCHSQDHCATLVSLPSWPLQSASVRPRAAAGGISDLQGIRPLAGGLKGALLLRLVILLQVFLGHLYCLFPILGKLLKKKNPIELRATNRPASTEPPCQGATSHLYKTHPQRFFYNKILCGCVTLEGGGENLWQFFKALSVLELDQDCIS